MRPKRDFEQTTSPSENLKDVGAATNRCFNQVEQLEFENQRLLSEIKELQMEVLSLYRQLSQYQSR